jgi:hypothetical protein
VGLPKHNPTVDLTPRDIFSKACTFEKPPALENFPVDQSVFGDAGILSAWTT